YLEWQSRQLVQHSPADAPGSDSASPRWGWGPAGAPSPPIIAPVAADAAAVVPAPGPGQSTSYEAHIRPLFRELDRQSMAFAFDLWSYEAVKAHAQAILERVRAGSMPCDGRWPEDKTELLQRWINDGTPP